MYFSSTVFIILRYPQHLQGKLWIWIFCLFCFSLFLILACKYFFPDVYWLREKLHYSTFSLKLQENGFSSSLPDSLPAGGRELPVSHPSSCLWGCAGFSRGVLLWLREAADEAGFANAFCSLESWSRTVLSKTSFYTWKYSDSKRTVNNYTFYIVPMLYISLQRWVWYSECGRSIILIKRRGGSAADEDGAF